MARFNLYINEEDMFQFSLIENQVYIVNGDNSVDYDGVNYVHFVANCEITDFVNMINELREKNISYFYEEL